MLLVSLQMPQKRRRVVQKCLRKRHVLDLVPGGSAGAVAVELIDDGAGKRHEDRLLGSMGTGMHRWCGGLRPIERCPAQAKRWPHGPSASAAGERSKALGAMAARRRPGFMVGSCVDSSGPVRRLRMTGQPVEDAQSQRTVEIRLTGLADIHVEFANIMHVNRDPQFFQLIFSQLFPPVITNRDEREHYDRLPVIESKVVGRVVIPVGVAEQIVEVLQHELNLHRKSLAELAANSDEEQH